MTEHVNRQLQRGDHTRTMSEIAGQDCGKTFLQRALSLDTVNAGQLGRVEKRKRN